MRALADFLLARIEEDESVARQAEVDLGRFDRENVANGGAYTGTQGAITLLAMRDGNAMDPARVLADCETKRELIRLLALQRETTPTANVEYEALLWLALPYAEHPDYDETWRP